MKRLPEFIEDTKAKFMQGEPGKTAKLVYRNDEKAMYLRDDGVFEYGIIKKQKAKTKIINGQELSLKEKELYWVNEDFGRVAETTSDFKIAEKCYYDIFGQEAPPFDMRLRYVVLDTQWGHYNITKIRKRYLK